VVASDGSTRLESFGQEPWPTWTFRLPCGRRCDLSFAGHTVAPPQFSFEHSTATKAAASAPATRPVGPRSPCVASRTKPDRNKRAFGSSYLRCLPASRLPTGHFFSKCYPARCGGCSSCVPPCCLYYRPRRLKGLSLRRNGRTSSAGWMKRRARGSGLTS